MWCGSVGQGGGRSQTEAVSELLSVVASRAAGDDANSRAAKPHTWQVAEGAKPLQILAYCHRHGALRQCGRVNAKPAARWAGAMEAAQFTCADALRGSVALCQIGRFAGSGEHGRSQSAGDTRAQQNAVIVSGASI